MKLTDSAREDTIRRLYGRRKWERNFKRKASDARRKRAMKNSSSMIYRSCRASLFSLFKTYTFSVALLEILEMISPLWVESSLRSVTLFWFSFLKYALPITDESLILIANRSFLPRSAVALVTGIFIKDVYKLFGRKRKESSKRKMRKSQSGIKTRVAEANTSGKWQESLRRYLKETIESLKRHYCIIDPNKIPKKQSKQTPQKRIVYPSHGTKQHHVSFQYDPVVPSAQTDHACMYTDTASDISSDDIVTMVASSDEDDIWQPTPTHSRYAPSTRSFASSILMANDDDDGQSSCFELEEATSQDGTLLDQTSLTEMETEAESFAMASNLHTASTVKYPIGASTSYPNARSQHILHSPQSTPGLHHQRLNSFEHSLNQYNKAGSQNPPHSTTLQQQADPRLESSNILPSYSRGDNAAGPSHYSKAIETNKKAQAAYERTKEWLENSGSVRSSTVKMGRICSDRIKQPRAAAAVRQRNRNVAAVIEETRRIGFAQHYLRPKKDK